MKQLSQFVVGLFMLVSFLVPQVFAQDDVRGITSHNMKHYLYAKQVLEQHYPDFLKAFQSLQEEIKTIDSSNQRAQFEALMRFMPFIDNMADMHSFDSLDQESGYLTLQYKVLVSFFDMDLPTVDKKYTSIFHIFCNAFMLTNVNSESVRILNADEMVQRHHMSREEALRVLNIWENYTATGPGKVYLLIKTPWTFCSRGFYDK